MEKPTTLPESPNETPEKPAEANEQTKRAEQQPAVALPTHAADAAPGLQSLDVGVRAVGAATVRVVNESRWRFPAREGGTEGLERERGVVGRAARPADDTPGEQVQDGGEVHPAGQRPERRHVGDPDPVRCVRGEVSFQEIGSDALRMPAVRRRLE